MKNSESDLASSFVERLVALSDKGDRGRLADLRRALSPTTEHQAWPALGALVGGLAFQDDLRLIYETVGALFALHPTQRQIGNIGVTCRHLAQGREDAFGRRFRRLLASDSPEDLRNQLVHIIKMAKSADKAVDYVQLFKDMRWFRNSPQRLKVEWARQYPRQQGNQQLLGSPHPRGDGPTTALMRYTETQFSPPAWGWSGGSLNAGQKFPVLR